MWRVALAYVGLAALCACANEEAPVFQDVGYRYFPTDSSRYVSYRVDSIYHDQPFANEAGIHDTAAYFLKEVLGGLFIDAAGDSSVVIHRYKRCCDTVPWELSDVWYARRSRSNAERVEENVRYVKMAFPISPFASWNGNALNSLEPWEYSYDSLYVPRQFGALSFSQTVKVLQRDFLTAVDDELAYEVYAANVGLVYRYERDLFTRPAYLNARIAENIIFGHEFTWEVIDYGVE